MAIPTRPAGGRARLNAYASKVARGLRGGSAAITEQHRKDRQDQTMEPANELSCEINPLSNSGGAYFDSGALVQTVLNGGSTLYEVSMSFWIKRGATSWAGSFGGILGAASDYLTWNDGFGAFISSDTVISFYVNDWNDATTITLPDDQEWHHIACTWAAGAAEYRVWVDNVEQITNGNPPAIVMDTTLDPKLKIGFFGDTNIDENNAFLSGHIDEVSLWGRALSETEVSWIYNQGRATVNLLSPNAPWDCRCWYRFGDDPNDDPAIDTGVLVDLTNNAENMTPLVAGVRTGTIAFTPDTP